MKTVAIFLTLLIYVLIPTEAFAVETFIPSPLTEVQDEKRLASNATWAKDSAFNIRATHDQGISVFFGITGGLMIFFGIMIALRRIRTLVLPYTLAHISQPLRLVLW